MPKPYLPVPVTRRIYVPKPFLPQPATRRILVAFDGDDAPREPRARTEIAEQRLGHLHMPREFVTEIANTDSHRKTAPSDAVSKPKIITLIPVQGAARRG